MRERITSPGLIAFFRQRVEDLWVNDDWNGAQANALARLLQLHQSVVSRCHSAATYSRMLFDLVNSAVNFADEDIFDLGEQCVNLVGALITLGADPSVQFEETSVLQLMFRFDDRLLAMRLMLPSDDQVIVLSRPQSLFLALLSFFTDPTPDWHEEDDSIVDLSRILAG